MEKGLLEKTGKALEYWVKIVKQSGIEKHSEIIKYLKAEHGFTHGFANFVSLKSRESDAASFEEEDLIKNQYSGKENLLPIYEELLKYTGTLGNDIEIAPKKANVSLRRKKQFALIQPSTKTRIDLGLKLKDVPPEGRLESSGPFGSMCTHRVRLESIDDINEDVLLWLKEAYSKAN